MQAPFRRAEPPPGWCHYFPSNEYAHNDRRVSLIDQLRPYLRSEESWNVFLSRVSLVGATKERTVLPLSFAQFAHACGVPDVLEAVSMQPAEALPCLSVAIHEVGVVRMPLSTPTLSCGDHTYRP